MSQIRNRSSKLSPSKVTPSCCRSVSAARAGAQYGVRSPQRRRPSLVSVHAVAVLRDPGDLVAPTDVDQRLGGDAVVEDRLGAALRDVDARRQRRAAGIRERPGEQLAIAVERACRRPRQTLARDPVRTDRGPDVEDVPLLADRLRADDVAGRSLVEQDHRDTPAGQQQRGGLPDRSVADHGDRSAVRA